MALNAQSISHSINGAAHQATVDDTNIETVTITAQLAGDPIAAYAVLANKLQDAITRIVALEP